MIGTSQMHVAHETRVIIVHLTVLLKHVEERVAVTFRLLFSGRRSVVWLSAFSSSSHRLHIYLV
jgi:hypothetical protein